MYNKLLKANWDSGIPITNIPQNRIREEGIKALLIDVDGTLLPRSEELVHTSVKEWIMNTKTHCSIHLISNNPSRNRIKRIASQLDINFTFGAGKPRKKKLLNCLNKIDLENSQIAIIGDRIFTDILGGNRVGIYTILVKAIGSNGKSKNINYVQFIEKSLAKLIMGVSKR
ncbi:MULTISPECIES: YqeG family HAD IIIA-type phosphatase [Prochlorococcus]|uniref:Predicted hydrolase of the HAD superfamily n=1 Tax=Prochlorococcus marinus (strain SARG / CCMP1375 / SS120) TaxID=167539 RepID=Q7VC77_PROMA|nr:MULTISPECIES: YqeG family HAD IIIA-type phosphatase [Prochlorococcus]AAP99909.1 Predicted hydrolase of the HAD superfamily [Prochlorococcus marinus subsp. marinus str. CCMP1375]KGG11743.1 Hydrolase [Prochlorococcus marinus str. LG]KGG18843.1 Hydrolase [Prochlorococcus marinus str. SS2]KGG23619.1 Hydrolase [Prochlorococcus marinus str. SS35]KGG32145.1 Hydrolase [Prochlorococcus marinus str. SS51]